jgi:RNA polymerase sigma-54 factor
MPLLQPRLNLKVAQRQILTPGLMQMVSVLALNKLELTEMINAEMIENPVLEEIDESVPILDEVGGREAMRERAKEEEAPVTVKDPFEEIDFGSYFQEYLDPGFRTTQEFEESEKPSFEQFLSQPTTLSDHLLWQLGSMSLDPEMREAVEFLVGNLNDDGYLAAPLQELAEVYAGADASVHDASVHDASGQDASVHADTESHPAAALPAAVMEYMQAALHLLQRLDPAGVGASDLRDCLRIQLDAQLEELELVLAQQERTEVLAAIEAANHAEATPSIPSGVSSGGHGGEAAATENHAAGHSAVNNGHQNSDHESAESAIPSLAAAAPQPSPHHGLHAAAEAVLNDRRQTFATARLIVLGHLNLLQRRDLKEISRAVGRPPAEISTAIDLIRTLDPRPGRRYSREQTRLIEPDVAFVKRGDEWAVAMNEEDMPTLRLSQRYRRMLVADSTDKEVKDYVKERFRSAMQLLRNIAQRKSTILRTCEVIVRRQQEFLEVGIEALRPMMIKEVAEEIGVHPSTVSRAVANKYAHTPQGVIELRFFFSEGANGPEGADTPLVVLKRKVRKLIEDENPRHPLTDDQLAAMLQSQGIQVTRRTVAKYREDMHIPSTHQRRRREA